MAEKETSGFDSSEEWSIVLDQFRRGELKECVSRLERIRFLTIDDYEKRRALMYLVRANMALHNHRLAMLYALEAAKIFDDSVSNFTLSLASAGSGDFDSAIHHLRKNIETSPFEATWHFQLGKLLSQRLHRYEEALSEFRWATKLEGSRFRFWLPVVDCLLRLHRFDEALRCVEEMGRRKWIRRVSVSETETEEMEDDFAAHSIRHLKAKVLKACGKEEQAEAILASLYDGDLEGGVYLDDESFGDQGV